MDVNLIPQEHKLKTEKIIQEIYNTQNKENNIHILEDRGLITANDMDEEEKYSSVLRGQDNMQTIQNMQAMNVQNFQAQNMQHLQAMNMQNFHAQTMQAQGMHNYQPQHIKGMQAHNMQGMQNLQNMQGRQNFQNMQNMQNIQDIQGFHMGYGNIKF